MKEKAIEYNTPAHICFVDLTKAFDRARLNDTTKTLIEKEVPTDIVKLTQLKHQKHQKTKIKDENHTENIFTTGEIR